MAEGSGVIRECVEAYLFSRNPLRLLIFRRPPTRGRIWVPVSGKVEPVDSNYEAATRREIAEETGITAPLGVWDLEWEFRFEGPDGRPWRLHAFAVEVVPELQPELSSEHDAFAWVAPDEALERLHYEDNREAVRRLVHKLRGPAGAAPPNI